MVLATLINGREGIDNYSNEFDVSEKYTRLSNAIKKSLDGCAYLYLSENDL